MQHPGEGRAHERSDEQLADPGMAEPLADGQNKSLRGRVHRHVGRLLNDVETLEVHPHGMGRIGHASVSEGVGREQITEFIIPARRGNSKDGDQGNANGNHQQPDHDNGQRLSPCQPSKAIFPHGRSRPAEQSLDPARRETKKIIAKAARPESAR